MMAKDIEEEVYEVPDAGEEATTSLGSLFAGTNWTEYRKEIQYQLKKEAARRNL